MHGAAAALAGVAADVSAGESELVAQEIDQQRAVFDLARVFDAVYGDFDFGHELISGFGIRVFAGMTTPD